MDLKSKQTWLNFLELYRKSGLTKANFCKTQKIKISKFYYYSKIHRKAEAQSFKATQPQRQPLFVPVTNKKDFKININDSVSLSFEVPPDAAWMASFIKSFGDYHASV